MDNILITKDKSIALSYIRAISAVMIVLCHVFQGLNNELAWWFNVGVQIFLFMSGFLMAKNKITSSTKFIKKRFYRILKPYYIAVILSILIYICIGKEITLSNIGTYLFAIQGITYKNTVDGLGHLWFVSLILLCYVITLLLDRYRKSMSEDKPLVFYVKLFISLVVLQFIVNLSGLRTYYGAWIGAYVIGYMLASRYKMDIPNSVGNTIIGLTLILIPIRLYFRYVAGIKSPVMNQFFNRYYVPWTHVLLGIFIFVVLYRLFSSVYRYREANSKIMKMISDRSYEIYLTHQIFILGPASLLFVTPYLVVNLVLITLSIALATWLVYLVDNKIVKTGVE